MTGIAVVNTVAGALACQESLDVYTSMHAFAFVYVYECVLKEEICFGCMKTPAGSCYSLSLTTAETLQSTTILPAAVSLHFRHFVVIWAHNCHIIYDDIITSGEFIMPGTTTSG